MNKETAFENLGEIVTVKDHVKYGEEMEEKLLNMLDGQKLTKQVIDSCSPLILLKKTVEIEYFFEKLNTFRWEWKNYGLEFSDELAIYIIDKLPILAHFIPNIENKTVVREYIKENEPRYLDELGDLTEEEFNIYLRNYGEVRSVTNAALLLQNNPTLQKKLILEDPSLLDMFQFSKEEEFQFLSQSFNPYKYKGNNFDVKYTSTDDEEYIQSLTPDTIYHNSIRVRADENGEATINVEGDVIVNAPVYDEQIPIFTDDNVQKVTIKSEKGARLILVCPSYCIPIGVEACTGMSYGRWDVRYEPYSLNTVELDNVDITIVSTTENLPLAGSYGDSNAHINIILKNGASVNGDALYSQKDYKVKLPYVSGSTKMSSVAKYYKEESSNEIQGF